MSPELFKVWFAGFIIGKSTLLKCEIDTLQEEVNKIYDIKEYQFNPIFTPTKWTPYTVGDFPSSPVISHSFDTTHNNYS